MKTHVIFLLIVGAILISAVPAAAQQDRLKTLIEQLNSENPPFQEEAAKELARLKDEKSTQDLIITLKAGNYLARKYAVWTLGEILDPRSIDSLRDILGDKDKSIVRLAKSALNRFGPQSKESLREGLKSKKRHLHFYLSF